jgi:hypothetical protein
MLLALVAAGIATVFVLSMRWDLRAVALGVAGLIAAPFVLYLISIVTFALSGQ